MSIILDALKAFVAGVAVFYCFGFIGALVLPWERGGKRLVESYAKLATSFLSRLLLMKKKHGGMKGIRTNYDPAIGAEKGRVGKEIYHWRDSLGMMKTFYGIPLGLVHEDRDVIFDARFADIARRYKQLHERNEWVVDGMRKMYFVLDRGRELVNPEHMIRVIPGQSTPRVADRIDTFVEKGEALYDSKKTQLVQTGQLIMLMFAGMGLVYIGVQLKRSTGGGAITGLTLGFLLLSGSTESAWDWITDNVTPFHAYVGGWVFVLIALAVWVFFTTGILWTVVFAMIFIAGASFVPILSFTVGSALGPVSGLLSTSVLSSVLLGVSNPTVHQTKSGKYRIKQADDDDFDVDCWWRLWFVTIGISYEIDQGVHGSYQPSVDDENPVQEGTTPTGLKYAKTDYDRGDVDWYVELEATADGGQPGAGPVKVPIGQKLNELEGTSGTALGEEAISDAYEKYGGNTSALNGRMMNVLRLVFPLVGIAVGWVIFI